MYDHIAHISHIDIKKGFGMGPHVEAGGESIHKEFIAFQAISQNIRNPEKRLRSIMKSHHTKVSRRLQGHIIHPTKRIKYLSE